MVIQRWQNLLLLFALIFTGLFCATSYAVIPGDVPANVYAYDTPVLLIINLVVVALLAIGISVFKNLKRQMTIANIVMVLICASLVTCGALLYLVTPTADLVMLGGVNYLILAFICTLVARNFMRKDLNLLRSYDRLR